MKYYTYGRSAASPHLARMLGDLNNTKMTAKVGRLWTDYTSKMKSIQDIKNTHNAICMLQLLYYHTLGAVTALQLPTIIASHLNNVVSTAHKILIKKLEGSRND